MIYMLRHGQTAKNKAHALQGRKDDPLNEAGRQEAREACDWFRTQGIDLDLVYTSPLVRAVESGRIAAPGVEQIVDERLIEMDYGPYEGLDLLNLPEEVLTFFKDFQNNPAPDGMEQLSSVVARAGEFLEEIRESAEGKNILISTHAIAMKGLLEYLTPESEGSYWSKYIGNCAIYGADLVDGHYTVPEELRVIHRPGRH